MTHLTNFSHNTNFQKKKTFSISRAEPTSLKIQNSHFTTYNQLQFEKNMETFRENIKKLILNPKMIHFPHFGHKKNFP